MSTASRGEVIITQKEAKGEYENAVWLWNRNADYGMPAEYGNQEIQSHAFDNTNLSGVPARTTNTGTGYSDSNTSTNYYCTADMVITAGDVMANGQQMAEQKSCAPNTGNVGNYYGWYTTTAGNNSSGLMPDSICPKGWQLPNGGTSDVAKSYASITLAYAGIGSSASGLASSVEQSLRESAASFIRGGRYHYNSSSRNNRGLVGNYWSGQAYTPSYAYDLNFTSTYIYPRDTFDKGNGFSVRCVAR